MKALKIVGIAVLAIIVVAVVAISFVSPKAHMERSIVVSGSPASVLEQFANFQKFNEWAPWAKMDPQAKYTYDGPESGVGAKMSWDGPETGKGSQETVEYEPGKRVKNVMKFDMMEGAMFSEVVVEPVPEGTKVTWFYDQDVSGTGPMNAAMGKFFGMNMDGMMGPQYEEGLNAMKQMVEAQPAFTVEFSEVTYPSISYVGIPTTSISTENVDAVSAQMEKSYGELAAALGKAKVEITGPAFCIISKWDEATKLADFVCAFPVAANAKVPAKYKIMQTESTPAIKTVHQGSYESSGSTHEQIGKYMEFKKLEMNGPALEIYVTDPTVEKDTSKWITEIYYPIKKN